MRIRTPCRQPTHCGERVLVRAGGEPLPILSEFVPGPDKDPLQLNTVLKYLTTEKEERYKKVQEKR